MSYRLDLFAEQDRVTPADVIDLWIREGAVDQAEAERRVHEVLVVATDEAGAPVGISTSFLKRNDQLQAELWHTRVFVATEHRQSGLAIELAKTARDHLCQRYADGRDRRGIGLLFEVESEILKRFIPQAVWPHTQFVFIGENARGDHVRVLYFPGALAPEPDAGPAQGSS
ncbi:MAG TPA: hypothetical protein VMD09_02650 [Solirubrobacteraceae bacterium]|nr:hypothetical protein [Solirubrobacteraceae bacterium]